MKIANLDFKSDILNTFSGKLKGRIPFSPRIYYWYLGNRLYKKYNRRNNKNIPEKYFKKSQIEIYRLLNCSPRYSEETVYFDLLERKIDPDSKIEIKSMKGKKKDEYTKKYITPLGILTETNSIGGGLGAHPTEYPIKSIDDMKIMKYILENTKISFVENNFLEAEKLFGNLGVVSTYLSHSPYQKLVLEYMGFTRTILFLKRYPQETLEFMQYLENKDDAMYEAVTKSPLQIVNFGENIDANLSSPPYFKKYLIPYYEKRINQLKKAGKYCHIHIDGSCKKLLSFLSDLQFDGYEALTPEPQGDVSLEEIKEAIGDKVLLDGIPSILFLPEYSYEYVAKFARKVLDLFSPNLILGISDELSPNGDIQKVEMISKIVGSYNS